MRAFPEPTVNGPALGRGVAVAIALVLAMAGPALEGAENLENRLDYWRSNFAELTAEADPRAAKAHEIFRRLLRVAGKRPGVIPRLFVADGGAPYVSLAFALPDGGVVISRELLDICYEDAGLADDRLAFVLAHEIAHQLKDDFWHFRFFQALSIPPEDEKRQGERSEVRAIAAQTDKVLAKELQADEQGIVYASMAGFDPDAILGADQRVDFFEHLYRSLDPTNLEGVDSDPTHPSARQRAETVRVRLRQIVEQVDLFRVGLLFYQAGDFETAALFFESFATFFPSREVYHDLAACHHQMAIRHFKRWKAREVSRSGEPAIPFRLSFAVDPETRATGIGLRYRGKSPDQVRFEEAIRKAVGHYETAISLDPDYLPAKHNLASALILMGEPYSAVGILRRLLEEGPARSETLNNLGVAYFYTEAPAKARQALEEAARIDPSWEAPLYNLARLAEKSGDADRARALWASYLELDGTSRWAREVRRSLGLEAADEPGMAPDPASEQILGVEGRGWADEMPEAWGEPIGAREFPLRQAPFRLVRYANGATVVSQDDEIRIVVTPPGYEGKSAGGIGLGGTARELATGYGAPAQVQDLSQWESWIYVERGIAFQLRDGKVVSWLLF